MKLESTTICVDDNPDNHWDKSSYSIERDMDQETIERRGITETENSVYSINQGTSEDSRSLVDRVVLDTVIVIRSDGEDEKSVHSSVKAITVLEDEVEIKSLKDEKHASVIDVKCGEGFGVNSGEERVCRICHMGSEQSSSGTTGAASMKGIDLIQLGCGCKDDLGIAHSHCAETWFKLKGNRVCEICGETAKNITGILEHRFLREWQEGRFNRSGTNSSERSGGCWRGQPFCNFLMACLVIAFVLPWFIRVDLF